MIIETGMIHGRFQPFHNGHFGYLSQALQKSRHLFIGITNPDATSIIEDDSDSHRHLSEANLFPYYARAQMISRSMLLSNELSARINDITIVPFPIGSPKLWKAYIPYNAVQMIRLLDPWDCKKQKMFLEYGFDVIVLKGLRLVSGTEIRHDIHSKNHAWENKVPIGSKIIIENWLKQQSVMGGKNYDPSAQC